jgi:NAD(P)-dependent dehydrogenase (short-subunit alcohol dehydrogenase family)
VGGVAVKGLASTVVAHRRARVRVTGRSLESRSATPAFDVARLSEEDLHGLLGHRSMEMTLTYARIADRVVADEYEAVTAQIDMLYNTAGIQSALPAEIETAAMTRLRREAHARMLGNGLCTRPVELECRMESACETCAYFQTGPEFVPVILRQRDHARDHHQPDRQALFDGLLERITGNSA